MKSRTTARHQVQTTLPHVLNIVNELAQKSMMDDYLYRGEPECYPEGVIQPLPRIP